MVKTAKKGSNWPTVSKTVDRTPLFSKFKAQTRPAIPPPIIATTGSSETGAVNTTCSWLKVFLRLDLLEVPYDDFLLFLEVGLLLGWDVVQVRVRVLGKKVVRNEGFKGFRGLEMREEGKEWMEDEVGMVFFWREKEMEYEDKKLWVSTCWVWLVWEGRLYSLLSTLYSLTTHTCFTFFPKT